MKTQLLCTFTTKQEVFKILNKIYDNFILSNKNIFVLSTMVPYEVICTYNIDIDPNTRYLCDTILVHRKKETNTMYTINALNEIIKNEKTNLVSWEKYRNCLLVTNDDGIRRIDTKLFFVKRF